MAVATRPRKPGDYGKGPTGEKNPNGSKRWWQAPAAVIGDISEVGQLLFQELAMIERYQLRTRFMHYISALLVDGRAPATFGFSMTAHNSRDSLRMSNAFFRPPSLNCIAGIHDVLKERVWSRVSWLEFSPIVKSDYELDTRCQETNAWLSSFFEATNFEEMISMCGADADTYGTTLVKTMPSLDKKSVVNKRVMIDEMRIFPDADFADPKHEGQVTFENREDLINAYASGSDKKSQALRDRLMITPPAFRGFGDPPMNLSDTIALAEGFRYDLEKDTKDEKKMGRHVLCLADGTVLVDEVWHESPYSVMRYNKLSRSYAGKGMPENCLGMQMELDRIVACRAEMQRSTSYPRTQIDRDANIDPESLNGNGVIEYTKTPARFDVVSGTPKDLDATIAELEKKIFAREGISQNTSGGDLPAGVDAAVAIEAFQQIADTRLYSHAKNLERFIEDVGVKTVKTAAIVKPKITVNSKELAWTSVAVDLKKAKLQAFPLSKLPSSLTGQRQMIEDWFKTGVINANQRARLLGIGNPRGILPLLVASTNTTLCQLGRILKSGEYEPPNGQCDPMDAYQTARSYYLRSFADGVAEDRLVQLLKFVESAKANVKSPTAPLPAPPAQPQGQPNASPAG